jgi:hypothetical protein
MSDISGSLALGSVELLAVCHPSRRTFSGFFGFFDALVAMARSSVASATR